MMKWAMVFATVAIVGGLTAAQALAGAEWTTQKMRNAAGHGFNDGSVVPIAHNELPGPDEDFVDANGVHAGTIWTGGNYEEFGRGLDRIYNREPTPWPGRSGTGTLNPDADWWATDYISSGVDVEDASLGTNEGDSFINWNYPGGQSWTYVDFDVAMGGDNRFRGEHRGGPDENGDPPYPSWTAPADATYEGRDSMTWEAKIRINTAGEWYTFVMGNFYNATKDAIWGRLWYTGRPGVSDELFIDGELNGGNENHLYDGWITNETYADLLQEVAGDYPGLDFFPEDTEEPGVTNQWITYRFVAMEEDPPLVRQNDDGSETLLDRNHSLYMTADPNGFGGGSDDGSWGLDGVPYLVGTGVNASAGWSAFHGLGFATTPAGASDIDHMYNLIEYGDGDAGAHPPVPEPATVGLMLLGGLLALRRRRA